MIESIAAAASSSNALRYAIDRAGQAFGPSSLDASTDLDHELEDFMLPVPVLDRLQAPFEQLGFSFEVGALNLSASLSTPPSYTKARRGGLELALIRLPDLLFGQVTTITVMIANSIGFAFRQSDARPHLFAVGEDGPTEFLDTAMKSWTKDGVRAVFQPWRRFEELDASADRAAFVMRVFELADPKGNGAVAPPPPPPTPVTQLDPNQVLNLHNALMKAYPSYGDMQLMLRTRVGKRLAEISHEDKLSIVALDVIEAAESGGWLRELVTGAREDKPGNPELQAAALTIPAALGGGH